MGLDISAANAALKVHYAKSLSKVLYTDPFMTPFMGLTARKGGKLVKGAFGQKFVVPLKVRDPQTGNSNFTKAQNKSDGSFGQSNYVAFEVPAVLGYSTGRITGQAVVQSQGDTNSFVDLMSEEIDGALRSAQFEIAQMAFRTGFGTRGRISARTTTTVTLANASDAQNFDVDMDIGASSGEGSGGRAGTGRITAINTDTGVITLTGVDPVASGWAVNDYLFKDGDYVASTRTKIWGCGAWVPETVPSSGENFAGVDRSSTFKLHGLRHSAASSGSFKDALIDASAKVALHRGKTTHAFCNPMDFGTLAKSLETAKRVNLSGKDPEYQLNYEGIEVIGHGGSFPVLQDATVPKGSCFMLNLNHIYWVYAGDELVHIADEDGNMVLRKGDADAYEVRCRSIANLVCDNPATQMVVYGIT
ncbi:MAG TPA: phage major capsid protein [Salinarimonas sp.]|nr:phage major capsid protein [Salinarimonas sp.]